MYNKIVMIAGVPRSGSSWVGQAKDSSPDTAYRFQPLFSWKFKDYLNLESSKEDHIDFFNQIYHSSDDFLLQKERREKAVYPTFKNKLAKPEILRTSTKYSP